MKWINNILIKDVPIYTSRGMVIGRPCANPAFGQTTDELEKQGLVGVYDPHDRVDFNKKLQCSGSITVDLGPNPFNRIDLEEIDKLITNGPESTLDDRIKELKNEQKNPKKYRARWTGTRYVYERIEQ